MFLSFEKPKPLTDDKKESHEQETSIPDKVVNHETPRHLRMYGDKTIDLFCSQFSVTGLDDFKKFRTEHPDEKFIISSSHLHNLDVPAALRTLGPEANIQITGESVLLEKMKYLGHKLMINLAGRSNFTPLDYKENKVGKSGVFNPDNFDELEEKMAEGKTPWIAAHPFALDGKMKRASIGPVYLAAKTGASVLPTALEVSGGSVNLEGIKESAKNLIHRSEATYHIGQPIKFPPLDVSIIGKVLAAREKGDEVSPEDLADFKAVHQELKSRADILAQAISNLLPEEKRGYYSQLEQPGEE
ncbi:MAG: hypothetical protein WC441_01210 [Patescibacteria group bacterium]